MSVSLGLFLAYVCGRLSGLIASEVRGYWNFLMIIPFAIIARLVVSKL